MTILPHRSWPGCCAAPGTKCNFLEANSERSKGQACKQCQPILARSPLCWPRKNLPCPIIRLELPPRVEGFFLRVVIPQEDLVAKLLINQTLVPPAKPR